MSTLYGITPTGTVVTRNTKADYVAGLVRYGELVSCSWNLETILAKATRPGDVVVGFTKAKLRSHDRVVVVRLRGRTVSYPRCYACDNPGTGRAERWDGKRYHFVPACRNRHALKEAS